MKKLLSLVVALFFTATVAHAQIINSLPFLLQNGTTADATQVMANFNQIVNNTNSNAASAGANSNITSLSALSQPPIGLGSLIFYGTVVGGAANAITIGTALPTGFSLRAGNVMWFTAASTNTGAVTLNVASTGAVAVKKNDLMGLVALSGGEIVAGSQALIFYDGTQFILHNPTNTGNVAYTAVASAATTTLGGGTAFKYNVTGNTTITSFGSAATAGQIFYLRFDGSLVLTYNVTSMVLPGGANISTSPGDMAVAVYNGSGNWTVTSYTRALFSASPAAVRNLLIKNNGVTPNSQIDVTADSGLMINGFGYGVQFSSISFTINAATNGANGMDSGGLGASGWYYVYMINDGSAVKGLLSASSTSPTLPSGYSSPVRVGAVRTDGSANLMRTRQLGRDVQYTVTAATNTAALPAFPNGSNTSTSLYVPTWGAQSVANFVPPTAQRIKGLLRGNGQVSIVAPNNSYGAYNSTTNPPITNHTANTNTTLPFDLLLESGNIYYATGLGNGQDVLYCFGWTDAVPAF